jgi:hypothetical protein
MRAGAVITGAVRHAVHALTLTKILSASPCLMMFSLCVAPRQAWLHVSDMIHACEHGDARHEILSTRGPRRDLYTLSIRSDNILTVLIITTDPIRTSTPPDSFSAFVAQTSDSQVRACLLAHGCEAPALSLQAATTTLSARGCDNRGHSAGRPDMHDGAKNISSQQLSCAGSRPARETLVQGARCSCCSEG